MKTKKLLPVLALFSFACMPQPVQIGHVNMVSNRNISEHTKYEQLRKFSGSNGRQQMRSRALTINDAIDAIVRSVPGGEYIMNAKLYKVGSYFAAEGDVWGVPDQKDVNGLKPNGYAYMRRAGKLEKVKIISFTDNDRVSVELSSGKIVLIDRHWLVPADQEEAK